MIPCRRRRGRVEVLLITSRTRGRWILPKGNLEPDLSARDLAEEEAYEEAGVRGTVAPVALGYYAHGNPCEHVVQVFLMHVEQELKSWPECRERRRLWLPLRAAQARADEPGIRRLLERVDDFL